MILRKLAAALPRPKLHSRFLSATCQRSQSPKTAIVMLNMGGPQKREDVQPYMTELFLDRELLKLPVQPFLGRFIAWRRTPQIIERYESALGGYSPTQHWFEVQGKALEERLDSQSPMTAPHKCYSGFRYTEPRTSTSISQLDMDAVDNVVLFSQYPQHSCSTTGSSFCDAYRYLSKTMPKSKASKVSVIDQWYHNPGYIKLWQQLIHEQISDMCKTESLKPSEIHIIYTAHSLPEAYVTEKGDKYADEITETVKMVQKDSDLSNMHHTLAWQSKVGPKQRKWLGPSTPDVLDANSHKAVLLVPIAFTCDHIETLDEIDIEFMEEAEKNENIEVYRRVACFNGMGEFSDILADIMNRHITNNFTSNIRGPCPKCEGNDCKPMRKYFNDINKSRKEEG